MRVTVLVERLDERRYRASTSHPITIETEGCSRDEAGNSKIGPKRIIGGAGSTASFSCNAIIGSHHRRY